MVVNLTAVQFQRFMATGKTHPAIFGCEDESGASAGEFVVKLRGGIETAESGLLRELVASKLAAHFGLVCPEPAVVTIEHALADLVARVEASNAVRIMSSIGKNYGGRLVTGLNPWPVDKAIPTAMWQDAVDVFAFDALIQNPDRRYDNQNLATKAERVVIFDHETAFSFLLAVAPSSAPWRLDGDRYLENHVFYRRLKAKSIDLTGFTASLGGLSDAILARMVADVPSEWNNDSLSKIQGHLRAARDHATEFADEVRRFLV